MQEEPQEAAQRAAGKRPRAGEGDEEQRQTTRGSARKRLRLGGGNEDGLDATGPGGEEGGEEDDQQSDSEAEEEDENEEEAREVAPAAHPAEKERSRPDALPKQLHRQLLEAKQTALSFAKRWQSPLAAGGPEDARAAPRVPGLFEICGARLMAKAAESTDFRAELADQVPPMLLDQLAASCGRRGRLQIQDFVAKVSLDPKDTAAPNPASKKRRHAVRGQGQGVCITTIHAAKGLEWPVVFVARWNQGFLPMEATKTEELGPDGRISKRELSPAEALEHLEEERRLAHVAATRAQRRLVVTYVRGFSSRLSGFDWKPQDPAFRSSLPLPEPLLPEGSPNAAMWLRVSPKAEDEPDWVHDCELVHMAAQP